MSFKEDDLKQIFKPNGDFQEEQDLIKNLYNNAYTESWKHWELQECLKQAISIKNTRNLINSNNRLSRSNKYFQISINILTWLLVIVGILQIEVIRNRIISILNIH